MGALHEAFPGSIDHIEQDSHFTITGEPQPEWLHSDEVPQAALQGRRRQLLADIGYAGDLAPQERWGWWWCHVCGTRPGQPPEEAAMPQRGCIGRCLHLYPHTPACRRLVATALHLTI